MLSELIDQVRAYVFPDYFDYSETRLRPVLSGLTTARTETSAGSESGEVPCPAADLAERFMQRLPEIARLLHTDVEAVSANDPAAANSAEVVLCYPAVEVMLHYRTAHELLALGVPVIPRMLTEMAHSTTGIDIHPAARIGEYFAIDHGTGIVIGETTVIGNHVMLYQGVTLGAKNFRYDELGRPVNAPRHPVIEDNVTIYSNTSVLGRVTIGHDTVVGGNVWLTHDVPPHSRIIQGRAISHTGFTDGAGL